LAVLAAITFVSCTAATPAGLPNGVAKAPLQIFKDHGYTWVRIRLMVDGGTNYALFQDLAYV
jgi:hypothetical protein